MSFLRRFSLIIASAFIGSLLFSGVTQALFLQSNDEVFLNEYLTEDVYLAGGTVTIQQDVEGDLFIAGGTITVNGIVSGDLLIAGGSVILNGQVKDDLRMVGGSLSLNGNVDGDMIVLGGTADLNKAVTVSGDLVVIAGSANVYGTVNRSVRGIMGRLTLGGDVNGNVDVRVTEKLVLLSSAHVFGNVKYFSPQKIEDHGGVIDGEVSFNEILSSANQVKAGLKQFFNKAYFIGKLWSYFALLLIGIFLVWLVPNGLQRTGEQITKSPLKSFGMGFLVFVVGGMASMISIFSVVGIQLGFIAVSALFILGELAQIVAAYWLGMLVVRNISIKKASSRRLFFIRFGTLALGLLILKLIGIIPLVGWLAGFALLMAGAGSWFLIARSNYRQLSKEKLV